MLCKTHGYGVSIGVLQRDIDHMGHVNNANHFTYFEIARVHYFNEVVNETINWSKQGIILAHMEIDYRTPILLTDEVWVYTGIIHFGMKSFEVGYQIIRIVNGIEIIAAEGKSVQVCFDYETNATIPIPELWKQKVLAYEPSLKR